MIVESLPPRRVSKRDVEALRDHGRVSLTFLVRGVTEGGRLYADQFLVLYRREEISTDGDAPNVVVNAVAALGLDREDGWQLLSDEAFRRHDDQGRHEAGLAAYHALEEHAETLLNDGERFDRSAVVPDLFRGEEVER